MARRYQYRRMTRDQLSAAFDAINRLDPTAEKFTKGKFVRLSGWNHQKVDRMFSGETDIPHETTVLLSILADPEIGTRAMEIARTVTDAMILPEEDEEQDNASLGERMVKAAHEARDIARGDAPPPPSPKGGRRK